MPSDPRDYKLDLSSANPDGRSTPAADGEASGDIEPRPFLQALFACCKVYQRIYRNPEGNRYDGACPKCGKRVRFVVGPGGTTSRSFVIE